MQYLVLKSFTSFGINHEKGTVVDESKIRSPLLRMSEGKITPAVSSSTVPAETVVKVDSAPSAVETAQSSQDQKKDKDTPEVKKTLFNVKPKN